MGTVHIIPTVLKVWLLAIAIEGRFGKKPMN